MKRLASLLLAFLMLVSIIPTGRAYANGETKLDVALLNDGRYMVKLPGVDYTATRAPIVKPKINPTDNPDAFLDQRC